MSGNGEDRAPTADCIVTIRLEENGRGISIGVAEPCPTVRRLATESDLRQIGYELVQRAQAIMNHNIAIQAAQAAQRARMTAPLITADGRPVKTG